MNGVIQHVRRILREDAGLNDRQLLEDYINRRDEAAVAALVRRHGPMVWGVCRRILRNEHDAEDAFQATFLVLIRRAASIASRELLANWLYGVAHQTALKARSIAAKRKGRERQVVEMPEPAVTVQDQRNDLQPLLDEELSRLPGTYRGVIVLCDLEGKTRKEAARQLNIPEGSVASRLARARTMLVKRLSRRGVALSVAALAGLLSDEASSAVPTSVAISTIKAATLFAAGKAGTTGAISVKVAALTEGVMKAMLFSKLKTVIVVVLILGFVTAGTTIFTCAAAGKDDKNLVEEKPVAAKEQKKDREPLGEDDIRNLGKSDLPDVPRKQEPKDAESWFRSFETKLAAATAVRIQLEGTADGIEDLKEKLIYKGTIVLAQGNKARIEMELELEGNKEKKKQVSDGSKMVGDLAGGQQSQPRDTPEKLFQNTISFFQHGGLMIGHVLFDSRGESNAKLKGSAFKFGKKEKIGARQAQVIEYELTLENAPKEFESLSLKEKLWLDAESGLPLKRVFTGKLRKEFTYIENYSEFTLDPKLDAKYFELPK